LHDRISDIFFIRRNFDVKHILLPTARNVGVNIDKEIINKIIKERRPLMNQVFYRYASSRNEPVVDKHLIEKALDTWSWFWVFLEASIIALISSTLFLIFNEIEMFWYSILSFVMWILLFNFYRFPCP